MKKAIQLSIVFLFSAIISQNSHAAIAALLIKDMTTNNNRSSVVKAIEGVIGFNGLWWGTLAALGGEPVGWVILNNPSDSHNSPQALLAEQFPGIESDPEAFQAILSASLDTQKKAITDFYNSETTAETQISLAVEKDQLQLILDASYFDETLKSQILLSLAK